MEEAIARLRSRGAAPVAPPAGDRNLDLLEASLQAGARIRGAVVHPGGWGDWPEAVILVDLEREGRPGRLPVVPGEAALERLPQVAGEASVRMAEAAPSDSLSEKGAARIRKIFQETAGLDPEERARTLMDWLIEEVDGSRCVVVAYEGGTPGEAIAYRLRGRRGSPREARHVPRRVLRQVAATRQPLVSEDVRDPEAPVPPVATLVEQKVGSYMAVPVVFRGDLLAVCYMDRYDRPGGFDVDQRVAFEAAAYAMAEPLLVMRADRRRREFREIRDALLEGEPEGPGIVTSPPLEAVLDKARRLAPHHEENILLLGETGVGKEVVARFLHDASGRKGGPFVPVNVAALSEELLESELMGSVKGAFTGATDRRGRIEEAEGGTLFLDEIGDLSLTNQVKLLRFLQDKEVRRVGGGSARRVDVRVVAATNRPVPALVESGAFREDLLHRFAPPLRIPPLRERREEILTHARVWLRTAARRKGLPVPNLSEDAEGFLEAHPWPGNVRQLQSALSHALLLGGETLDADTLEQVLEPGGTASGAGPSPVADTWEAWCAWRDAREKEWLRRAYREQEGNIEATARALEMPSTTLRRLLERHGLLED